MPSRYNNVCFAVATTQWEPLSASDRGQLGDGGTASDDELQESAAMTKDVDGGEHEEKWLHRIEKCSDEDKRQINNEM